MSLSWLPNAISIMRIILILPILVLFVYDEFVWALVLFVIAGLSDGVDGYLAKNYPGKEKEVFEELEKTQPVGRMGKPEEVADLIAFLASDLSSYINAQNITIDGGL